MRQKSSIVWLIGMVVAMLGENSSQAQYEDLVTHIPETANAMILVNAKAIFDSPIAKRENWQADRQKRFTSGLTSLPPRAAAP